MVDRTKEYFETAKALRAASEALEHQARRLRNEADRLSDTAKHHEAVFRKLGALPHYVNLMKANGESDPIGAAAHHTNTHREIVEHHHDAFTKRTKVLAKRQRDREIARLARQGLTNREIGQRMGVSVSTVQRVLRQASLAPYRKPKVERRRP